MINNFSRGSEWRRWDLHLHTASSYDHEYKSGDSDEKIVEMLRKEKIAAVAITDHFIIDAKRINNLRKLAPEITFFPGVELRTDKLSNNRNLHVILIFSETMNLTTLQQDFEAIMLRKDAIDKDNNERIHWTYESIIDFANSHDAIVTIHAGNKPNGIDRESTNSIDVSMAIKQDIAESVDFFEVARQKDIDGYNEHIFKVIKRRPVIICSDNHDPRNYEVREKLWIKANPTFEGLKQCIYQPEERVFVGEVPPLIDRIQNNKQLVLDEIKINQVEDVKNKENRWFNTSLKLNPGLVSIIGNKGSGKSALSDILGHITESKNMSYASFLSQDRFKKQPINYADDYYAKVSWLDGKVKSDRLSSSIENNPVEYAQYLPQQYIELVCNDLGDSFQSEIDKVIFSYVDESERGEALNLDDLVSIRSTTVQLHIDELKKDLSIINNKIIKIEEKCTNSYKESIKSSLESIKEEISRHEANKPKEVEKPKNDSNVEYQQKLKDLNNEIKTIEDSVSVYTEKQKVLNNKLSELDTLSTQISFLIESTRDINNEITRIKSEYNLEDLNHIDITSPLEKITEIIKSEASERDRIKTTILNENNHSDESLLYKLDILTNIKTNLIGAADSEEKAYQKYISDLKNWEKTRNDLIGDTTTDNTLKYFEKELHYIENKIKEEYEELKNNRQIIVKKIFEQKRELASVYLDIYQPIESKISEIVSKMDEEISFEVELKLINNEFAEHLLKFINQRYAGLFQGKSQARKTMDKLIKETDFSNWDSLNRFINNITDDLYDDLDVSSKKIQDKESFYKELFGLDFIGVNFQLKMGTRSLTELSPGERGIVLLTFYLALSKENKPIIIDQPEDNLDNQSVYRKLVPCINEAKRKRQVFIVTHNPNIAIACDSDQIIYASMDEDTYEISYDSGAIEDKKINQYVIDILEGTMPAFDLRRRKYKVESISS